MHSYRKIIVALNVTVWLICVQIANNKKEKKEKEKS